MGYPLKAWFLGPKGENARAFENLLVEVFRDYIYWRRNFHTEDTVTITESDKGACEGAMADFRQRLFEVLAELKKDVPFFSPRYVAHMQNECCIPGLLGYIAAMLYNPNNVTSESSPRTTEYELQAARQFGRVFGYPDTCWGHITSGGTLANLEALWIARNLKFFPTGVRLALLKDDELKRYVDFQFEGARFVDIAPRDLMAMSPDRALQIGNLLEEHAAFKDSITSQNKKARKRLGDDIHRGIERWTLRALGWNRFQSICQDVMGFRLPPTRIFVPQTRHYSWGKAADIIGVGRDSGGGLVPVGVDAMYRMDVRDLDRKLKACAGSGDTALAVVAVVGSTEEGSVDPVHEIVQLKDKYGFYLHLDGAWGGYFSTLLHGHSDETYVTHERFRESLNDNVVEGSRLPVEQTTHLFNTLRAFAASDSITVDPHKLGYLPYPAGAIVFRDERVKALVDQDAPYIFQKDAPDRAFIGQCIIEGSKPGAAAAALHLANATIPLSMEGYGAIIKDTMVATRQLFLALRDRIHVPGLRLVPVTEPDSNIIVFVVNEEREDGNLGSLGRMNRITESVYAHFSPYGNKDAIRPIQDYEFIVAKTDFQYEYYRGAATDELLRRAGVDPDTYVKDAGPADRTRASSISVINLTVMNPWTGQQVENFCASLERVLRTQSMCVLVVEDERQTRCKVKHMLAELQPDMKFRCEEAESVSGAKKKIVDVGKVDFVILDLMLPMEDGQEPRDTVEPGGEVLEFLRENKETKAVPVIVYTALRPKASREHADAVEEIKTSLMDYGFDPDLDKLIPKETLRALLDEDSPNRRAVVRGMTAVLAEVLLVAQNAALARQAG